jgi:hypothetical protein
VERGQIAASIPAIARARRGRAGSLAHEEPCAWNGTATIEELSDAIFDVGTGVRGKQRCLWTHACGDLDPLREAVWRKDDFGAGELEAVQQKDHLGGGAQAALDAMALGGWDKLLGGALVRVVNELCAQVALVGGVALGQIAGPLLQLVQLPGGSGGVHPRHACQRQRRCSPGKDYLQAFKEPPAAALLAAGVQPQDARRQDAVDGGRGLLLARADDGEGLVALHQHAACIRGSEAALEVHGGAKAVGLPGIEVAQKDALQIFHVGRAGCIALRVTRRGGAAVSQRAGGPQLQQLGLRMTEALRRQPQGSGALDAGDDGTHQVALCVPQVQRAAVMLGGERVLRAGQIEDDLSVFHDGRFFMLVQEARHGGGDRLSTLDSVCGRRL